MFPSSVALVPYTPNAPVSLDELSRVASALELQMLRDFGPVWGVAGTVSAFPSLEAMPPEYLPIVFTDQDIPVQTHGFHFTVAGVPFALVPLEDGWELAASHEFLEMVLDPSGALTRPGRSLTDEAAWVDYLVEVCDPCEHSGYDIHGVTVSDFVTPHYYSTAPTEGSQYSFLGTIQKPLQVLGQGYLTWRTRLPQNQLYQAFGGPRESEDGDEGSSATEQGPDPTEPFPDPAIGPVPHASSRMTRASVSLTKARRGTNRPSAAGLDSKPGGPVKSFGEALRDDIGLFLDYVQQRRAQRAPTIDEILDAIEDLAPGGAIGSTDRATLYANVKGKLEIDNAALGDPPDRHQDSQARYDRIVEYLKEQKKVSGIFGPDLMDPGMGLWMAMHIL